MYVLTGIYGNGKMARVWDSNDGSTDEIDFITLAREVTTKGTKVYGIQKYDPNAIYPPDHNIQQALGIVIIPSEAQTAIQDFTQNH